MQFVILVMELQDIVVTIIISVSVGLTIMYFQRKLENKVDKLIIKQNQIIEEEHKREEDWIELWGNRIITDLTATQNYHEILERWLVDYMNNRSDTTRENLIFSSERLGITVDYFVQNIKENMSKIANFLKNPLLSTLIIKQCDHYPTSFKVLSSTWVWEEDGLSGQIQVIEDRIRMLVDVIEQMRKETIRSRLS